LNKEGEDMYRFSIKGEEWIVRFSPQISIEAEEREAILQSILHIGNDLSLFKHGDAFLVVDKNIGVIVFKVERIPSLILTVCNIIPEENCYFQ
jgi:hypothetical protein